MILIARQTDAEFLESYFKVATGECSSSYEPFETVYVNSKIDCAVACERHPRCVSSTHTEVGPSQVRCDFLDSSADTLSIDDDGRDCTRVDGYICE